MDILLTIAEIVPNISGNVANVIMRCLRYEGRDRYKTAQEAIKDLSSQPKFVSPNLSIKEVSSEKSLIPPQNKINQSKPTENLSAKKVTNYLYSVKDFEVAENKSGYFADRNREIDIEETHSEYTQKRGDQRGDPRVDNQRGGDPRREDQNETNQNDHDYTEERETNYDEDSGYSGKAFKNIDPRIKPNKVPARNFQIDDTQYASRDEIEKVINKKSFSSNSPNNQNNPNMSRSDQLQNQMKNKRDKAKDEFRNKSQFQNKDSSKNIFTDAKPKNEKNNN